jgi:hypothetical protein
MWPHWHAPFHNRLRHLRPGAALGLAIILLLTMGGHTLMVAGEGGDGVFHTPRRAAASTSHNHCAREAGRCGPHAPPELSNPANAPVLERCGPLTPWKSAGGDGGERQDRVAPAIVVSDLAIETWPMPGEPAHLDPPDVRRAFLQVYLN